MPAWTSSAALKSRACRTWYHSKLIPFILEKIYLEHSSFPLYMRYSVFDRLQRVCQLSELDIQVALPIIAERPSLFQPQKVYERWTGAANAFINEREQNWCWDLWRPYECHLEIAHVDQAKIEFYDEVYNRAPSLDKVTWCTLEEYLPELVFVRSETMIAWKKIEPRAWNEVNVPKRCSIFRIVMYGCSKQVKEPCSDVRSMLSWVSLYHRPAVRW